MQDSFDIDSDMRRTQSTSTFVSEALSFYSIPGSLSHPKELEGSTGMETVLGQNRSTEGSFAKPLLEKKDDAATARSTETQHAVHSAIAEKETPANDTLLLPSCEVQRPLAAHRQRLRITDHSSQRSSVRGVTRVHKGSSRRSSVAQAFATTNYEAQQSSRRSSSRHISQSSAGSRPQPVTVARRSSTLSSGATFDNPYLTHQRARQIFQSFGSTLGSQPARNEYQEPLIGTAIVPLALTHTQNYDGDLTISHVAYAEKGNEGMTYSPTPCTIIDWTAPATRRREYEKIDRSSRGVRGLWRKVTPRWCRGSSRTSFFEGDEDDARSVRRYRLDISEEHDAEKEEGIRVREREVRPSLLKSKTTWSCFSFEGGKKKKIS
ncbi:hypothetical protein MMC18_002693 [Xylographa bjoerkii]|nr:hypothetical protein [Xylographa bjoerkii]